MKSANFNDLRPFDKVYATYYAVGQALTTMGYKIPAINGSIMGQNVIDWMACPNEP